MSKKKKAKAEDFVHLHVHSDMSQLDGCGKIDEYVETAAKRGAPAIAFTEHGTMRGYHAAHSACEAVGIKAVHGVEFYLAKDMHRKGLTDEEKDGITTGLKPNERKAAIREHETREGIRDRWHLTVWAKNDVGLKNLFKLTSASYLDGFYYKPRIDVPALLEHGDGLVVATGCMSSLVYDRAVAGRRKQAFADAERLRERFGEDLWIEVQPHNMTDQVTANKFALELRRRWGGSARLLATQDAHYVRHSDACHHEALLCIGTNDRMSNVNRFKFDNDEFYLKTRKQMHESFCAHHSYMGKRLIKEALDSTLTLAESITAKVKVDYHAALLPAMEVPEPYRDEWAYLKGLCFKGWLWRDIDKRIARVAERRGEALEKTRQEYKDRVIHELNAILRQKFVGYFLMVHDIYDWARSQRIMCGPGRGSVAGSLVSFLLGLTSVDPIEHGLIFERFLNPARIDMPDVDMDFEDGRRHEIMRYLRDKYGHDKVAQIATISKLSGKQCVKDVSRVLEVPYADVNEVTNSIIERSSGDERASQTIADSFKDFKVCREFDKKYPDVLRHARRLEGLAKNLGIHAAGVVVAPEPLVEYLPLEIRKHNGEDLVVTALDMHGVSATGLVKLDVLGLRTLTVIRDCLTAIEERHGMTIDPESDIDLEDPEVLQLFTDHDYSGIFQYDTPGADKICGGVSFDRFEDVAAMTALNRPGTARSGLATQYVARKKNPELVKQTSMHPLVSEITADTLGIIVYQEHVIKIFMDIAGFPPGTADSLRKAIAKKKGDETIGKERQNFIDGAAKRTGMDKKVAAKIMDAITFFGCLEKNTEVNTPTGHVPISKTKKGDSIWSVDDRGVLVENKIKNVAMTGKKATKLITTDAGSVIATDDQWWKRADGEYEKTLDLKVGTELFLPMGFNPIGGEEARVISIQDHEVVETWDLECVYEPHNYVLSSGLTTHNSYGFNKSHATAYGIIAYWGQWLKRYYPIEFYWSLLSNEPQRIKIQQTAKAAKKHDIELLPPDVSISQQRFTIDPSRKAIRGSLVDIKGVGEAAAITIMANQPYESLQDFLARVDRRKCHKGVVLALAKSGALDGVLPNVRWFVEHIEEFWRVLGRHTPLSEQVSALLEESKSHPDYAEEERQLVASAVSPLAFGRHPIDAYQDFMNSHVGVPITSMGGDDFYKDNDNKAVFVAGVIVEVKYNQIGDFHTGALPSEADREKEGWGQRYSNVNVEDASGVQNRIKFDIDVFDDMRPVIDAGIGTPVVVHATVNGKFENMRADFAVDLEAYRKRVLAGADLAVWEEIVAGRHPALVRKWKSEALRLERVGNTKFCQRGSPGGPFCGVVTHVKTKVDKRGAEMAFFGLLGARSHIEVVCFGSHWGEARGVFAPGRLVIAAIERQRDQYRGWSHFYNGGGAKWLKDSATK